MSSKTQAVLEASERLVDWYWNFREQRTENQSLENIGWVSRVYRQRDQARALNQSRRSGKAVQAIWGPSQVGKSTLLSGVIDSLDDETGKDSPLSWPGGTPARFSGPKTVFSMNPYNGGADASGCVCRFRAVDEVDFVTHPVILRLANFEQVRLALALGYLDECEDRNAEGDRTFWSIELLKIKLDAFATHSDGAVSRDAIEVIHELCVLLERLCTSGRPRYENLRRQMTAVRQLFFSNISLRSNPVLALEWMHEVLWDRHPTLNNFSNQLEGWLKKHDFLKNSQVFCSLQVAAHLLDISAYRKMKSGDPEFADLHKKLRFSSPSKDVVLLDYEAGQSFCRSEKDFGLFQGLIWEMTIHLRTESIRKRHPAFAELMRSADLLDFPGVANTDKGVAPIVIDPETGGNGSGNSAEHIEDRLLTEVLKRGKTSAIVYQYAESLEIDGFTIMCRSQRAVPKTKQLASGIRTWLTAIDQTSDPEHGVRSSLPLNLAITFASGIINDVLFNQNASSVRATFKEFPDKLGWLANPDVLHCTFAVTYPQLPSGGFVKGGNSVSPGCAPLATAAELIEAEQAFNDRFRTQDCRSSFEAMWSETDGGIGFMFSVLANQSVQFKDTSINLSNKKKSELLSSLNSLIEEELPPSDLAEMKKKQELDMTNFSGILRDKIYQCRKLKDITALSSAVRNLFAVPAEALPPPFVNEGRLDLSEYCQSVVSAWQQSRGEAIQQFCNSLDLEFEAQILVSRVLKIIADSIDQRKFADWMRRVGIDRMTSYRDALRVRQSIALWVSRQLPTRTASEPAPDSVQVNASLAVMDVLEPDAYVTDIQNSPEWRVMLNSLITALESVRSANTGHVKVKAGDAELMQIAKIITI